MIFDVTPFVGVWIETSTTMGRQRPRWVTPFVGVWIETSTDGCCHGIRMSYPSWVCGLKLACTDDVTLVLRHTLRGCVD